MNQHRTTPLPLPLPDAANPLYHLWVQLSRALVNAGDLLACGNPWESTDQAVLAAWEAITRPENIPALNDEIASGFHRRSIRLRALEEANRRKRET